MPKLYEEVGKHRTKLNNIEDYKIAPPSALSSLIDEQKYEVLRREGYSKNQAEFGSKNQFIRYAVNFVSTDKKTIKIAVGR